MWWHGYYLQLILCLSKGFWIISEVCGSRERLFFTQTFNMWQHISFLKYNILFIKWNYHCLTERWVTLKTEAREWKVGGGTFQHPILRCVWEKLRLRKAEKGKMVNISRSIWLPRCFWAWKALPELDLALIPGRQWHYCSLYHISINSLLFSLLMHWPRNNNLEKRRVELRTANNNTEHRCELLLTPSVSQQPFCCDQDFLPQGVQLNLSLKIIGLAWNIMAGRGLKEAIFGCVRRKPSAKHKCEMGNNWGFIWMSKWLCITIRDIVIVLTKVYMGLLH